MDPITQQTVIAAAGAGGGDPVYVDDVFSTYLYTGTGSAQTITNGIDISGEGGLVWIKNRESVGQDHALYDTERGAGQTLASNTTTAQFLSTNRLSALNSNGFTVGTDTATNASGNGIASWTFRKAPGFFDVVTYTGNGTAGRTVAHNLGSVPGMIIVKRYDATENWTVYHRSTGTSKFLFLDDTMAAQTASSAFWNNTAPTSTNFTVGTNGGVNASGGSYVAYIFAHDDQSFGTDSDESIIKCGTYAGNGSSGQIINLGFEAQWLMIKSYTRGGGGYGWTMVDMMRDRALFADENGQESGVHGYIPSPNGIHLTNGDSNVNESGESYIYMAIRRPHKPPTAATEVFAVDYGNSSSTIPCWDSGFPVDLAFWTYWDRTYAKQALSRLTGTKYLYANATDAEANDPDLTWDSNLGWGKTWNTNTISWMFKRAPGFMDVVAYTGTGSARTVSHNLEAIPELVIIKARTDAGENWAVYNSFIGNTKGLNLNRDKPAETTHARWNSTSPTSTQFTVDSQNSVNYNTGTYVAYLFATLSGISKVGNYTGTGNDINVDCGFSSGARFVLIKRTDSDADWFLFDTLRGIAVGNDPYLLLNMAAIQVTNTDYIDPLNAGFTVTSSAPAALNTSGGTYIFLAIA